MPRGQWVWSVASEMNLKDALALASQIKTEKKKKSFLFPVLFLGKKICTRRFGRFTRRCETARLARRHLTSNLHVPGCHP